MSYSLDLRRRVVAFVRSGGSKSEASRLFCVNRGTVYEWLSRPDLSRKAYVLKEPRKLDRELLRRHVNEHPDMLSKDRAAFFGVVPSAMCKALKQIKITRKKNS